MFVLIHLLTTELYVKCFSLSNLDETIHSIHRSVAQFTQIDHKFVFIYCSRLQRLRSLSTLLLNLKKKSQHL